MLEITPKLFQLLFQHSELTQPISVLDFGCASFDTVNFFNQFHSKLYFADFNSDQQIFFDHKDLTDEELTAEYQKLMDFPSETKFDILFFWDFFSLLDTRAMQAFNAALMPYVSEHAQAYGFGALSRKGNLEYLDYQITGYDQLRARSNPDQPAKLIAHGQSSFDRYMPPFRVKKGILMNNGRLEVLLQRRE